MAKMLGQVDLLGLNAFGRNPGMNALYGTLIGGGTAGIASLMLKRRGASNPDMKGFLAGVVVSAAMYAMKKTRHASFGSLAGAFFAAGLSWLAGKFLGAGATPTAGMGLPQLQALNGLGVPQVQYLNGSLGIPGIAPVPPMYGGTSSVSNGLSGAHAGVSLSQSPPVDLLGRATAQSAQAQLMGVPALSGLSSAYGATLLGGGRN